MMNPILKLDFNARYTMSAENGGYRFRFYCAFCDGGYTTGLIHADCLETALSLAKQEAKHYFNGCHKCGKWICDRHYNIDEMTCTECMPHPNGKWKVENGK